MPEQVKNEMTMKEFDQIAGKMLWNRQRFVRNGGGAPDPDSRRGFGSTSQCFEVPTENGWTILYIDNGGGIASALSPENVVWRKKYRMDTSQGRKALEEYFLLDDAAHTL